MENFKSLNMRLAVLFSGGKDSTYALYKMIQQGHEVRCLVTIFPESEESWMFHHPCIELTRLQAEAMSIQQIIQKTKGEKEKELEDLKNALEKIKGSVEAVVSGAVESMYQKSRINRICKQLGLKSIAPLWHKDPEKLLMEQVESGFKIILTSVSAEGFDRSWLGREIDEKCIEDLKELHEKYGIHMAFEGGEAETFVWDGPILKKEIKILDFKTIWDSKTNSGYLSVNKAILVDKLI